MYMKIHLLYSWTNLWGANPPNQKQPVHNKICDQFTYRKFSGGCDPPNPSPQLWRMHSRKNLEK